MTNIEKMQSLLIDVLFMLSGVAVSMIIRSSIL